MCFHKLILLALLGFCLGCKVEAPGGSSSPDQELVSTEAYSPQKEEQAVAALKEQDFHFEGKPVTEAVCAENGFLKDKDLVPLRAFTHLQRLELFGTPEITDKGLANIENLVELTELSLNTDIRIDDAGMKSLRKLTNLRK